MYPQTDPALGDIGREEQVSLSTFEQAWSASDDLMVVTSNVVADAQLVGGGSQGGGAAAMILTLLGAGIAAGIVVVRRRGIRNPARPRPCVERHPAALGWAGLDVQPNPAVAGAPSHRPPRGPRPPRTGTETRIEATKSRTVSGDPRHRPSHPVNVAGGAVRGAAAGAEVAGIRAQGSG